MRGRPLQHAVGPGQIMAHEEIDAIRAMLAEKPRPVGWAERRARLDEVGSVWPVAGDMSCESGRLRRRAGRMVARAGR